MDILVVHGLDIYDLFEIINDLKDEDFVFLHSPLEEISNNRFDLTEYIGS